MLALVIGSAACVWDDLSRVTGTHVDIAVNSMIRALPYTPMYGCTVHPERAAEFVRSGGGYTPTMVSTGLRDGVDLVFDVLPWRYGTSALYAVAFALQSLHADHVVLAGCPLDFGPHFDGPYALEPDTRGYRSRWMEVLPQMRGRVTSMSGWTKELLESEGEITP